MSWEALIGAAGVGAIATKLLDILWLQRMIRSAERVSWLRDKRLEAYSELCAELLSLGKNSDLRNDAFEGYALATEAILLTDDDTLAEEIELFFTHLSNLFSEAAKPENDSSRRPEKELEGAYHVVYKNSRRLVKKLRASLHAT